MLRTSRRRFVEDAGREYQPLERRQMLAVLFMGTSESDQVRISYLDSQHVKIQINDTLHENVDSSEGIRFNLLQGEDQVSIDHRVADQLVLTSVEDLAIDGGNSEWFIGYKPELALDGILEQGTVVGTANGNISFSGVKQISAGGGDDTINVHNAHDFQLSVFAGAGDDLLRVFGNQKIGDAGGASHRLIALHGEAGRDRFVFRGVGEGQAFGGDGTDIEDYRLSDLGANRAFSTRLTAGDYINNGIEKIFGSESQTDRIRITNDQWGQRYEWFIKGASTLLQETTSGKSIDLVNFDIFDGGSRGNDRYWVQATVNDVVIGNPDFLQISSTLDATQGNLNLIQHNVSIVEKFYQVDDGLVQGVIGDDDGVSDPTIVISDRTGGGTTAAIGPDQTIRGLIGGDLSFSSVVSTSGYRLRSLTIHGSDIADDHFAVYETWSSLRLFAHGGDDTFMLGGSNADESKSLDSLSHYIFLGAGLGQDRIDFNDQQSNSSAIKRNYHVSDDSFFVVEDGAGSSISGNTGRFPYGPFPATSVYFNAAVEVVRLNSSLNRPGDVVVLGLKTSRLVVDNSDRQVGAPQVTILSPTGALQSPEVDIAYPDAAFESVFFPGGDAERIYFNGVSDVVFSEYEFLGEILPLI